MKQNRDSEQIFGGWGIGPGQEYLECLIVYKPRSRGINQWCGVIFKFKQKKVPFFNNWISSANGVRLRAVRVLSIQSLGPRSNMFCKSRGGTVWRFRSCLRRAKLHYCMVVSGDSSEVGDTVYCSGDSVVCSVRSSSKAEWWYRSVLASKTQH